MAEIYVSSSGSATAPFETWAKAQTSLVTALNTNAAPGDVIIVDSAFAEGSGGSVTIDVGDNIGNPIRVISVDKTGDPAGLANQTYQAGATLNTTASTLFFNDSELDLYGMTFFPDSDFRFNSNCYINAYDCTLRMGTAGTRIMYMQDSYINLYDCKFYFGATTQRVFTRSGVILKMTDCALHPSSSAVDGFIRADGSGGSNIRVDGFDFSGAAAGADFLKTLGATIDLSVGTDIEVSGVDMPATGDLVGATFLSQGSELRGYNSGSGSSVTEVFIQNMRGTVVDNQSAYVSGQDSDGQNWSFSGQSTADVDPGGRGLRWLVGVAPGDANATITLNVTCAAALTNKDFWFEVIYPESGTNRRKRASTQHADFIAGGSTALPSGGTWTGGLGNNYQPTLTIADGQAGTYQVFANLARASTTALVDPRIVIT